jgi:hypothetical protein
MFPALAGLAKERQLVLRCADLLVEGIDLPFELLAARIGDSQAQAGLLELLPQRPELGARRRGTNDNWRGALAQQLACAEPGRERDRREQQRRLPARRRRALRRKRQADAREVSGRGPSEPDRHGGRRAAHSPAR